MFLDSVSAIGNTPLIRLSRLTKDLLATIAVKTEGANPAGSVKCRVGAAMIQAAEKQGILKPGTKDVRVIEATSGNTGIALAFVCASRGYKLILTMPETMSMERRKLLQAFGAELVLTPGTKGMKGALTAAEEIMQSDPDHYFMPQQFDNPANPEIHFTTTGPEIWRDTAGKIDVLVCGVGTGGTISGVSRYLKEVQKRKIHTVAVEPVESAAITAFLNHREPQPQPHIIQGIGAGFLPAVLDLSTIDEVIAVSGEQALHYARRLHLEEGIGCGISGGAALCAACELAKKPEYTGKLVVVVLPDFTDRYLSTALV